MKKKMSIATIISDIYERMSMPGKVLSITRKVVLDKYMYDYTNK